MSPIDYFTVHYPVRCNARRSTYSVAYAVDEFFSSTIEISRDGGMLKLDHEWENDGPVDYLKPETIGDQLLICSTMGVSGKELPVRFELDGGGVEFDYERAHYEKEI